MTVAETLAGIKKKFGFEPSAEYKGTEDANDFIFAIPVSYTHLTLPTNSRV